MQEQALVGGFMLAVALVADPMAFTPRPIRLQVQPTTCRAPCTVSATLTVAPDATNRHASVVWGYSDSEAQHWELNADGDRTALTVQIPALPRGQHTIYAVLLRDRDGHPETFEDAQHVSVE